MTFPLEGNWGWCSLGGKAENKDVCSRRRAIVWLLALAHRGMSGGEQGSVSILPLPPTLLLNRSLNPMGFLSQTAHRSMLNLSLLTHCLATNTSLVVLFSSWEASDLLSTLPPEQTCGRWIHPFYVPPACLPQWPAGESPNSPSWPALHSQMNLGSKALSLQVMFHLSCVTKPQFRHP